MYDRPRFLYAGDRALVVELGDGIDPDLNRRLHSLRDAICKAELHGVSDLIATYRSLLVYYDPISIDVERLKEDLARIESRVDASGLNRSRIIHLPTFYGGEYGPDLDSVAEHTGLPTEQVVETHSAADYLTYMMGFSPGFPYLGGLDERLHTPRLSTPRTEIPAGSVGIADSQTGVYPVASPGGWRLIGRTPLRLFDPASTPPSLLVAGDYVRFTPLASEEEYLEIEAAVTRGEYVPVIEETG